MPGWQRVEQTRGRHAACLWVTLIAWLSAIVAYALAVNGLPLVGKILAGLCLAVGAVSLAVGLLAPIPDLSDSQKPHRQASNEGT